MIVKLASVQKNYEDYTYTNVPLGSPFSRNKHQNNLKRT